MLCFENPCFSPWPFRFFSTLLNVTFALSIGASVAPLVLEFILDDVLQLRRASAADQHRSGCTIDVFFLRHPDDKTDASQLGVQIK